VMGCIRRRLMLVGILMLILSVVMSTQYATTKVPYSFGIVHPSNADIRYIGSDNSSADEPRVLRIVDNVSGSRAMVLYCGNHSLGSVRNFTACFGIVNEEQFPVNITYINVSGNGSSFMSIWLHGNRTEEAALEGATSRFLMVDAGVSQTTANSNAWILNAGNGDPTNMNGTAIQTTWDQTAHIRYNSTTLIDARNGTKDFIWVQVSISLGFNLTINPPYEGQIWIHYKASTHGI
jgi:hypothetical protein